MHQAAYRLSSELTIQQMSPLEVATILATEPSVLPLYEVLTSLRLTEVDTVDRMINAIQGRGAQAFGWRT